MIHILGVPDSSKYQRVERKVEELHSGQIRPVQKWKFHGGQSNAALRTFYLFSTLLATTADFFLLFGKYLIGIEWLNYYVGKIGGQRLA